MSLKSSLETILTQPTAPFRESWVTRAFMQLCASKRLSTWEDDYGNLWVGVKNKAEARRAGLVLVAHTDHPGFVITGFRKKGSKLFADAKWLGGGPKDVRGHRVQVFSHVDSATVFDGIVRSHTNVPHGPDTAEIEILGTKIAFFAGQDFAPKGKPLADAFCTGKGFKALGPWGACLWYDREAPQGIAFKKGKIVSKACDDLVGAVSAVEALAATQKKGIAIILTRGEECGFHGTLHVLRTKMLDPRKTIMLSIETSSRLPNAVPGKGPIVRMGDRMTVFNPGFVHWMTRIAQGVLAKDKSFAFQRRIMDAGSCEATAFNAFGFKVAGVSSPLVNYHNQFLPTELLEGKKVQTAKPNGAHPEIIEFADVERQQKLLTAAFKAWSPKLIGTLSESPFVNLRKNYIKQHLDLSKRFA